MSLSWFNRQGRGRKANRTAATKRARQPKIQLHDLEDRTTPAVGTIQFDIDQVTSYSEGTATAKLKILLVTDNTDLLGSVTANIAVTGGTASNGGLNPDYTFTTPNSVTFNSTDPHPPNLAGNSVYTQELTITFNDDTIIEAPETINFTITSFSQTGSNGISIGEPKNILYTITDNDTATVNIANVSSAEDIAGGNMTFNVTLTGALDIALPVNVNYTNGTATGGAGGTGAGIDYDNNTDTTTFGIGVTGTQSVTVALNNDTVLEATENFLATISAGVALGGRQVTFGSPATGQITDNETAVVSITGGPTIVTEDPGTTPSANLPALLTITANGTPNTGTLGVDLVANLSASAGTGVDYTTTPTTFTAGTASGVSQNIVVNAINDGIVEANPENFNTNLTLNANGSSATPSGTQVVRVVDNDTATFTINDVTVNESAGTLTFSVSLSTPIDTTAKVNVSFADVTTSAGDFTHTTIPVTFAANSTTSQNVVVPITDDNIVELNETFTATLALDGTTPLTTYNTDLTDTGTGTIVSNNDTATFTINDQTVNEAAGTMTFTVNLSNPIATAALINVNYTDVTATGGGTDYDSATDQVSYAIGEFGNKTVTVAITEENLVERQETFTASLALDGTTPLTGYLKNTSDTGTGTINDNDTALFNIDDPTVNEAAGTMTFNISLSNPIDVLTQVNVSFSDITTSAGDFGHSTLTASFNANTTTTQQVTIPITNDNLVELTETFNATMALNPATPLTGYSTNLADVGLGTIQDNDTATFTIGDVTANEGAGTMTFTVSLSNPIATTAKVNVSYSGGTATGGGTDYDSATDQVTFVAGDNTPQTVTVAITDDNLVELQETFNVALALDPSTPLTGYASNTTDTAVGTITDNDTATFTILDQTVNEAAGTMTLTVNLSNPIATPALVNVSYSGGTAVGGGTDYDSATDQVSYTAGQFGNKTVTVAITNDLIVENTETFNAALALDPSTPLTGYASNTTDTAVGTITDNDTATFTITDQSVNEDAGTMTFTINLSNAIDTDATVNISYGGGTATGSNVDYDSTVDTVTYLAGQLGNKTFTVAINDDTVVEANETFNVTQALDPSTPLTGYLNNLTDTAVGTIVSNNDSATIQLAAPTSAATEGGSNATVGATLTISGNGVPNTGTLGSAVTVNLAVVPAGAADVTLPTAPAYTFAAGSSSTTQNATVIATNDTIVEPTEAYNLSLTGLSAPSGNVILTGGPNTLTITDNDFATVSIPTGTTTATENGANGSIPVTLTITGNGVAGNGTLGVDVTVALTPGDDDFTSNSVLFNSGNSSSVVNMTITAVNDRRIEASPELGVGGPQTLWISGLNPAGANVTVAGTSGTQLINIVDNDFARLIYNGTANVAEGSSALQIVTAQIQFITQGVDGLPGNLSVPGLDVQVDATVSSVPTDFSATTVSWLTNEAASTKNIEVTSVDDRLIESSTESLTAVLDHFTPAAVDKQGLVTVNIVDNDSASVAITTGTTSVTEGGGTGSVTATLTLTSTGTTGSTALEAPISVNLPGNADYTSTSATFGPGALSGATSQIVVSAVNDTLVEGTETFSGQTGTATSTATVPVSGTQTVVVSDNDTASFTVNDVTVNEAAGTATFTVTPSNALSSAAAINVSFTDVTTDGGDFNHTTQTITFPANSTAPINVVVPITGDSIAELTETFTVNLALNTGLTPLTGFSVNTSDTGTGTITDDDAVIISISDVTLSESGGTATFNLTSNKPLDIPLSIIVNYGGGTATPGQDYDGSTDIVTYPANQTGPIPVTVSFFGDNTVELNETFIASISTSTPLGTRSVDFTDTGLGTITNDDSAAFFIDDVLVNESAGTATFTVTLTNPIDIPVDVAVGYSGGTATGGGIDYDSASDTVTFLAGSTTSKQVTVAITDDNVVEQSETFTATLSSTTNLGGRAVTVTDTGTGTISDNDTATFSIDDVVVNEGDTATFTVTLDKPLDTPITITVHYTDQTATGGGTDYDSANDTVLYGIGEFGTKTVQVATTGDNVNEAVETFLASLTASAVGTRSVNTADTAIGTIIDHNEAPIVNVPGAQNFLASTPLTILGVSTTDPEAALLGANVEATLSVTNGGITLASLSGLTFSAGDGTNDATMTFQGSLASVNAAIASLLYRPTTDTYANDVLTVSINDLGSTGAGGPMTTTQTIALNAPSNLAQLQPSPTKANVNDLVVYGTSGNDTILVTVVGTKFKVTVNNAVLGLFSGVNGRIVIFGGAGNDSITVAPYIARPSYLDGGTGNDSLTGGKGRDTLSGGEGSDSFKGGAGIDLLYEKADTNFTLTGGTLKVDGSLTTAGLGNDVIFRNSVEWAHLVGGAGDNTINTTAFAGRVTLMGGAGNDNLSSGKGADVLVGGDGNDVLNSGDGRDILIGGQGTDVLTGGNHEDILVGSSTAHDNDAAALSLLMAEWANPYRPFIQRTNHINGANTYLPLNKTILLRSTTVFNDFTNDTFTGGGFRDYFVNFLGENVADNGTGGLDLLANLVTN